MNVDVHGRVAQAICYACGENPFHQGDCEGNDYRWQDYLPIAAAAIEAMHPSKSQSKRIVVQEGETP